ncbi:MAG: hypothetical protein ACIAXF_10805 [Phycisphaerales bacterium JB063]
MHRGTLPSLFVLTWLGVAPLGCATGPGDQPAEAAAPSTDAPADTEPAHDYTFERDDYDAVFDSAIATLRDAGFRLARKDRRFGVITTYPLESPTMFEPWVEGNETRDLARRSTLNELRRVVTVRLEPADGASSEVGYDYRVSVTVGLERRQAADRYLTHSARGQIAARYRDVPAHLAQRGIPAEDWEPAGDDPQLARRLLLTIGERSAIPQARGEYPSYDGDGSDE